TKQTKRANRSSFVVNSTARPASSLSRNTRSTPSSTTRKSSGDRALDHRSAQPLPTLYSWISSCSHAFAISLPNNALCTTHRPVSSPQSLSLFAHRFSRVYVLSCAQFPPEPPVRITRGRPSTGVRALRPAIHSGGDPYWSKLAASALESQVVGGLDRG